MGQDGWRRTAGCAALCLVAWSCHGGSAGPGLEPPFSDDDGEGALGSDRMSPTDPVSQAGEGPTSVPTAGTTSGGGVAGAGTAGAAGVPAGGAGGDPAAGGDGAFSGGSGGFAALDAGVPTVDAAVGDGDGGAAGVDCDPRKVTCERLPPTCGEGTVPSVDDTGCYGPCVAVEACACSEPDACPQPESYTCHNFSQRCGPYL